MSDEANNVQHDDEEADSLTIDESSENKEAQGFYWKQTRENLFTPSGERLFQLAYSHKDEEYDTARVKIDREYDTLSPRLQKQGRPTARHGGYFSTYITFLEEMGLMYREQKDNKVYLRATPAGDQAAILLGKLPPTLRIVPYFRHYREVLHHIEYIHAFRF